MKLYSKGLTTRDVSDILKGFFGEEVSCATVSNLEERFNELRKAWEKSHLEIHYKVVYGNALYITVRRGSSYAKEAVHILYGIRDDNRRELLDISINPTESASSWSERFAKLKQRAVTAVDLFVADGLPLLEDEIHKHSQAALFKNVLYIKGVSKNSKKASRVVI